jgi:hypothetical protein
VLLIHSEIQLEFSEKFRAQSTSQQLYKALTGRTQETGEQNEQAVVFRSVKKRQSVGWDTDSCAVIIESATNDEESIHKMIALLEKINQTAPIGKLSKTQFISYWILKSEEQSFKALEEKYRENFILPHPLWKNVYDSSVITDMKIDKNLILHHQSGAMESTQLRKDYAEFKVDGLPRVFLFLWTAIETNKIKDYSAASVSSFLSNAFRHCKLHAALFEEAWRQIP